LSKALDDIIKTRGDKLCEKFEVYLQKQKELLKLTDDIAVDFAEYEFFVKRRDEDKQEFMGGEMK